MREEPHTILQLLRHTKFRTAIIGIKGLIVAITTTAHSFRTIPIGTGKPCMDRNLLHLPLEILSQEGRKIIVQLVLQIHAANLHKKLDFFVLAV